MLVWHPSRALHSHTDESHKDRQQRPPTEPTKKKIEEKNELMAYNKYSYDEYF